MNDIQTGEPDHEAIAWDDLQPLPLELMAARGLWIDGTSLSAKGTATGNRTPIRGATPGLSHLKLPEPGYELDEVIVIPSSALELAAH